MKIDKYLSSILPSFTRGRLLDDLGTLREELKLNTLPPIQAMAKAFGKRKFENEWVRAFDEGFKKESNIRYNGNFIVGVEETLTHVQENMDVIERLIGKYYADDVVREAMTVMRVNLMQYLETISFCIQYSRRLMVAAISMEVATVNTEPSTVTEGELGWLNVRRDNYFSAIRILSDKKQELEAKFEALPDMALNADSYHTSKAVVGEERVDPFNFGLIPIKLNPIYHIRMAIADWQVSRFKAAQEEKRMLEFKLLQMKLAADGKKDARLQEQIDYTQGRLEKLNYKLAQMEEDYGTA